MACRGSVGGITLATSQGYWEGKGDDTCKALRSVLLRTCHTVPIAWSYTVGTQKSSNRNLVSLTPASPFTLPLLCPISSVFPWTSQLPSSF